MDYKRYVQVDRNHRITESWNILLQTISLCVSQLPTDAKVLLNFHAYTQHTDNQHSHTQHTHTQHSHTQHSHTQPTHTQHTVTQGGVRTHLCLPLHHTHKLAHHTQSVQGEWAPIFLSLSLKHTHTPTLRFPLRS